MPWLCVDGKFSKLIQFNDIFKYILVYVRANFLVCNIPILLCYYQNKNIEALTKPFNEHFDVYLMLISNSYVVEYAIQISVVVWRIHVIPIDICEKRSIKKPYINIGLRRE